MVRRNAATTTVPHPNLDGETVTCDLYPWQTGWTLEHTKKGISKQWCIDAAFEEFLDKAYNSVENPCRVFFHATPGSDITPGSVGLKMGFAKHCAMKMLMVAIVETKLSDEELLAIAPHIQCLLPVRCTYTVTGDEKNERFEGIRAKFLESSRARPDPIQISECFLDQARSQGLAVHTHGVWRFSDLNDLESYIQEFNSGTQVETKQLSLTEITVLRLYPTLDPDTQKLIDYHWSQYDTRRSGLPFGSLCVGQLTQGLKARNVADKLWAGILGLGDDAKNPALGGESNRKKHHYVARRIGIFLNRILDAQRLRKKVNISSMAKSFRDDKTDEEAWACAVIFHKFFPEWQTLLDAKRVEELETKYRRGYLDSELIEKYRVQSPEVKATSFRFLVALGLKDAGDVPAAVISSAQQASQHQEIP